MYKEHHKYYPICSDDKCKEVRYNLCNDRKDIIFTCTACGNNTKHKVSDIPTSTLYSLLGDVIQHKKEFAN